MTPVCFDVWGDSIARGVSYDSNRRRYTISRERFSDALADMTSIPVENHGKMGATSQEGLHLFEQAAYTPGAALVIEYGGNDCDLNWAYVAMHPDEPVRASVPIEEYERNLRDFITLGRARGLSPIVVTPPPLHSVRYFDWVTKGLDRDAVLRALGEVEAIYRWQERYAIAAARVARQMECPLFDARDAFLINQRNFAELMSEDGIHPNDAGHRVLAKAGCEAVKRLLAQ